jgi:hypothetical protein
VEEHNREQNKLQETSHPSAQAINLDDPLSGVAHTDRQAAAFTTEWQYLLDTAGSFRALDAESSQNQCILNGSSNLQSSIDLISVQTAPTWQGMTSTPGFRGLIVPPEPSTAQPIDINNDRHQESLGYINDAEFSELVSFDPIQDELLPYENDTFLYVEQPNFDMPLDTNQFGFGDAILSIDTSSDTLTNILELENACDDATAPWDRKRHKHGKLRPAKDTDLASSNL